MTIDCDVTFVWPLHRWDGLSYGNFKQKFVKILKTTCHMSARHASEVHSIDVKIEEL